MNITVRKIKEIVPYESNPRRNDAAVDAVAASISEFGWKQPIVVDRDGVIVAGHTRYKAAQKLGLTEAPCVIADDLTEEQVRAYRLADNKTAELADWDDGMLTEELEALSEIDMSAFGFDLGVFDDNEKTVSEDDYTEPELLPTKVKAGDLWMLGNHRLICGDSTDPAVIDRLMGGAFARLTVTSPPYGVGKDYEEAGVGPWRQTVQGAIEAIKGKTLIICWNIGDLFATGTQFTEPTSAYSIQMMDHAGYGMLYARIWRKPGANFAGTNMYYTVTTKPAQDYEYIFAFAEKDADRHLENIKEYLFSQSKIAQINNDVVKSIGGPSYMCGHWFTDHQWSFIDEKNYKLIANYCKENDIDAFDRDYASLADEYLRKTIFSHVLSPQEYSEWGYRGVWEFPTVHERLGGHAAAFPVELPTRLIKMHSYPGDIVVDPFGGTGTTMIACEQLDRRCQMIERDPHYCDVIIDRWETFTGKKAERIND